jgi:predicted cation transporter
MQPEWPFLFAGQISIEYVRTAQKIFLFRPSKRLAKYPQPLIVSQRNKGIIRLQILRKFMLDGSLSELCSVPLLVIALAMPFVGAFVRRRELWFDGKLASALQEINLNVILAMIIVVLGLSAILITPILPLLALGVITLLLPFDRRETTQFVMLGSLSTAMGALTTADLPLSRITSMRLEGSPFATTFLSMLNLHTIIGIAAIGILSLFFLKKRS